MACMSTSGKTERNRLTFQILKVVPLTFSVIECAFVLAVQFQIIIQNRYKLNKKYRKVQPAKSTSDDGCDIQTSLEHKTLAQQAKVAASRDCICR